MKEFSHGIVAVSALLFAGCASSKTAYKEYYPEPEEIIANAVKVEPCEWKEIVNPYEKFEYAEKISTEQLESDLDMLCYLLRTAYAGYDKSCERGLNLEDLELNLKNRFDEKEISVEAFFEAVKDELSGKIQDTHFSMQLNYWFWHFCDKYIVYYSDIFVQKTGDSFEICEIGEKSEKFGIKKGEKYDGDMKNLFYYPAKGSEVYRIGEIAKARLPSYSMMYKEGDDKINVFPAEEKTLTVQIGGKKREIVVKSEVPVSIRETVRYGEKETEDSAYISLSHFMPPESDSVYRKGSDRNFTRFMEAASKFQGKKNLIVDLRSNSGGNSNYGDKFFTRLYVPQSDGLEEDDLKRYSDGIVLKVWSKNDFVFPLSFLSPANSQNALMWGSLFYASKKDDLKYAKKIVAFQKKSPCKITYNSEFAVPKIAEQALPALEKPAFTGKLIIIIDRNSASASELFIQNAKNIFGSQCLVVGENSTGCIEYGSVFLYRLPESKIFVSISSMDLSGNLSNIENWHGEGFGMYPEIWSCGADLLDTLVFVTGDKKLRNKIPNIEWALQ